MEPVNVRLKYKQLALFTENFSESSFIGRFQFGKLYRADDGVILPSKRHMLVKIWEVPEKYDIIPRDYEIWEPPVIYNYIPQDYEFRLMEEITLLRHEVVIKHPGMVKLYGYCCEGQHLGVVYEFKPFDSVFNLITKDSFTWLQRVKTAFVLASLLKFLHARPTSSMYKPFVVQNLDAAHIVLDEEYNPKLCDFGMISGGMFPEKTTCSVNDAIGCYGHINTGTSSRVPLSNKQDVLAFGVILISLISKRVYTEEDRQAGVPFISEWALGEPEAFKSCSDIKNTKFLLVHESLESDSGFCVADGHKITLLAVECVNRVEAERPTMKQVFRSLLKLEVVKHHTDFIGARPSENGR